MSEHPAEYVVFWPGQEVLACKEHMNQLNALNSAMGGAPLSARNLADIGESGECANCVNEAKKND